MAKSHPRPLRRARWLQGFGGLILAACSLFPAVDGCSTPFVPAKEIWQSLAERPVTLDDFLVTCWIAMPYLVGIAYLGVMLRWKGTLFHRGRCVGSTVMVLLAIWTGCVFIALIKQVMHDSRTSFEDTFFLVHSVACLCTIAFLWSAFRRPAAAPLCARWFAGCCCILWFGGWFVAETASGSRTYYGLWLSLASSILIAAGAFLEALAIGTLSSMKTLGGLLTCRIRIPDPDEPRCSSCGYLLYGLPTNRCPECGNTFEL